MLYPSELRAHWGHYRRFFAFVYRASSGFVACFNYDQGYFRAQLLFRSPVLMFLSLLDLFPRRCSKATDGRS